MINQTVELVGTLMFYAIANNADDIKQAVKTLEGNGNVVIGLTPIYKPAHYLAGSLEGVFIQVAGEAKVPRPGTSNAS